MNFKENIRQFNSLHRDRKSCLKDTRLTLSSCCLLHIATTAQHKTSATAAPSSHQIMDPMWAGPRLLTLFFSESKLHSGVSNELSAKTTYLSPSFKRCWTRTTPAFNDAREIFHNEEWSSDVRGFQS